MRSLYWRIFLAFWLALTLILVGTVTVAVNVALIYRSGDKPWVQRGEVYATAAHAFEQGGPAALKVWLKSIQGTEPFSRTYVLDPSGHDLLGRPLPKALTDRMPPSNARAVSQVPLSGALVLVSADGSVYRVLVGPVMDKPRLFGELELPGVPTATLLIALAVSGAVCFLLARYLVAPIDRLRHATRRLAAGDLSVRVLPGLKGRQDDLARLAADLDTMAERVRTLLETKQQLLRDVSHELRSPLARLQLALSLAQGAQHGGIQRHLVRIGAEADRLEELIARTLRLARLEAPAAQSLERAPLMLKELLAGIVCDVGIEADAQGCTVSLTADGSLAVQGDRELLRSAFENVIRNAVSFSPAGGSVVITAVRADATHSSIQVRDQGPGVPEKDLSLIFEPFYRVDAARPRRDRAGGGDGLGLAIAARAVALHGGRIEAGNAPSGGLIVAITLPALPARDTAALPDLSAAASAAG